MGQPNSPWKAPESKRYIDPVTEQYMMFPYDLSGSRPSLYPEDFLRQRFPLAYAHLLSHKEILEARDGGDWVGSKWYGYSRSQNLDKQFIPKLCSARLVPSLRMMLDEKGVFCLHDNNMFGILPATDVDVWFLLGILNARVTDFVFRRSARPKSSGYFQADRQFLAPLPIPDASLEQRAEVGTRARELQELHTRRRDTIAKLDQRLHSAQTAPVSPAPKEEWLWSAIRTPATWKQSSAAPAGLSARDLTAWAKQQHAAALQERHDTLDALLQPGVAITVTNTEDELALHIGGREILRHFDRLHLPFTAAQWRHALRGLNVTEAFNATRLLKLLLTLRTTTEDTLRDRILALDQEITTLDQTLATKESELNALIYQLYHLTPEEIAMVEGG